MSYTDYISDDDNFDEDNLDEEDFDEDDLDEDDDDEPEVYEYKVVGVTFANDDGTNRQELLRKIKSREEPFKGFVNYSLQVYSYEGKTAVAVLGNGIMIGNIPKENAENIAEHMKYIDKVFVRVFGGEDDKKFSVIVRLTVTPPRIDVEKLLADRRAASTPAPAPEKSAPQKQDEKPALDKRKDIFRDFSAQMKEWLKKPINRYLLLALIVALLVILLISYKATHKPKDLVGLWNYEDSVSSEQDNDRLDLSYETLSAIAQVVGKLNNITYNQIEYINEAGSYSAGLYSPDNGVVRYTFNSDAPDSKAKNVDVTIYSALVTDESTKIVGDTFDQLLRFLDSDAYMNIGFSKIYKELSSSYETNGTRGEYFTNKLEFNYWVINDNIVITVYPK